MPFISVATTRSKTSSIKEERVVYCQCGFVSGGVDASKNHQRQRHSVRQRRRRRRRSNTSAITAGGNQVWTVLALSTFLPSILMLRSTVSAFTTTITPAKNLRLHKQRNSYCLSAVSSRELRFYNGASSSVISKSPTSEISSQQHERYNDEYQLSHYQTDGIPEVLAASFSSMPNFFFASNSHMMMNDIMAHENEEENKINGRKRQQQQHTRTTTSRQHANNNMYSSSSSSTTTRRTISSDRIYSSTSTTTVMSSTVQVAPQSLLLSQQTFRSFGSDGTNGYDKSKQEKEEEQEEDDKQRPKTLSNNGILKKNKKQDKTDKINEINTVLEYNRVSNRKSNVSHTVSSSMEKVQSQQYPPPRQGYGYSIQLTDEERKLFHLLRKVHEETHMTTTLRVAGGWVRDKLLATPEFQIFHHDFNSYYSVYGKRLTSKFKSSSFTKGSRIKQPSMGRQGTKILRQNDQPGPVDIDIALDTMLGREFADHLNSYLQDHGKDTVSVGVVLKNPEKSKHLETATMKVGSFWIDFVNLRAEEYADDSRIPDLMRIGTASEDAFRRDLTINSLFYNINTGQVEDWTGRGFADLRRGIVATPLAPLTTLLDDPLRVLRSIRFAARLRFTMGDELIAAARDDRVRMALAQKVSRERVGGEVDLMLRSPDPVGAMRLLSNLNMVDTVFPVASCLPGVTKKNEADVAQKIRPLFERCLRLLSTTHDHLFDCKISPPIWCQSKRILTTHNAVETTLTDDEEARRLLWYAAFLKPIHDYSQRLKQQQSESSVSKRAGKKANRSIMSKLLVDELKRPGRDGESVEKIMNAANEITQLVQSGSDLSATLILLSDVRVTDKNGSLMASMRGRSIDSVTEEDPVWEHAMEFRLMCSRVLRKVGGLWRAALMLSLSEQLASLNDGDFEYAIEGDVIDESKGERRQGIVDQYDTFAAALQQIGLIGIWGATPLIDGKEMKKVLPYIPRGPAFRDVMDEQERWITTHPGASKDPLMKHLQNVFPEFTKPSAEIKRKNAETRSRRATKDDQFV